MKKRDLLKKQLCFLRLEKRKKYVKIAMEAITGAVAVFSNSTENLLKLLNFYEKSAEKHIKSQHYFCLLD